MRAFDLLNISNGSLLAEYAARMTSAELRNRAESQVDAARTEAEMAIKARSELLSNLNHELRTPLNAIIGFATMLRQQRDFTITPDQEEEYLDYILQSADLLLGHINMLLEIASLENGEIEMNCEQIDLSGLLTDAINNAQIRAQSKSITIQRKDDGASVIGVGDKLRVHQSISHLLGAAIKSSANGSRILVRAAMNDDGAAEIVIRDEGVGFDSDELASALTSFDEVNRGLCKPFTKPGIEYAIAKFFIDMQGGHFFIKSRKGKGTLVRICVYQAADQIGPHSQEDGDEEIFALEELGEEDAA